jgi:hypothetical protein
MISWSSELFRAANVHMDTKNKNKLHARVERHLQTAECISPQHFWESVEHKMSAMVRNRPLKWQECLSVRPRNQKKRRTSSNYIRKLQESEYTERSEKESRSGLIISAIFVVRSGRHSWWDIWMKYVRGELLDCAWGMLTESIRYNEMSLSFGAACTIVLVFYARHFNKTVSHSSREFCSKYLFGALLDGLHDTRTQAKIVLTVGGQHLSIHS